MNIMEMQSNQINELAGALAKAQKTMGVAVYDKQNPHFKSKYASYAAIRKACEILLADQGLSITHILIPFEGKRAMITQLMHVSGQWIRSILVMPQDKETPQGVGSNISYAMRYSLSSLLAIPAGEDDDDGEAAEKPYRESPKHVPTERFLDEDEIDEIDALIGDDMELLNRMLNGYQTKFKRPMNKLADIPANEFKAIVSKLQAKREMK